MTQNQTVAKLPLLAEAALYYVVFANFFALLNRWVIFPISLALRLPPYQNVSTASVRVTYGLPDFLLLVMAVIALVLLVKYFGLTGALANVFFQNRPASLVFFLQCTGFFLGLATKGAGAFLNPHLSPLWVYPFYFLFVAVAGFGAGCWTKLLPRDAVKVAAVGVLLGLLFSILQWLSNPVERSNFAEITRQVWPFVYLPIPITLLFVYLGAVVRQSGSERQTPRG